MDQLRALRCFVRVVDAGGFAAAARALDFTPAAVTRAVAELESHLGARLLQRTTRRVNLTDVGEAYLERARQLLADLSDADAMAASAQASPRGTVSVLCTPSFAVHQLAKRLPQFAQRHPEVTIELTAHGPVTTVDEAHDVSLVVSREALAGDFVARPLASSAIVICASSAYLARFGWPERPEDLTAHRAILPPLADFHRGLVFRRGAQTQTVVRPQHAVLSSTHVDTMYVAALAGLGVAGLPSFVAEDALREGRLERLLPDWQLFDQTLWAAMPSRRYLPARTRAFVEFLADSLGAADGAGALRDPWLPEPVRNEG